MHTDNKLKPSIEGTGRALPHVGFETLLRREAGMWGEWVHLNGALDLQHNTIRCVNTTLYRHSNTVWRVDTLLNHQYPIL